MSVSTPYLTFIVVKTAHLNIYSYFVEYQCFQMSANGKNKGLLSVGGDYVARVVRCASNLLHASGKT